MIDAVTSTQTSTSATRKAASTAATGDGSFAKALAHVRGDEQRSEEDRPPPKTDADEERQSPVTRGSDTGVQGVHTGTQTMERVSDRTPNAPFADTPREMPHERLGDATLSAAPDDLTLGVDTENATPDLLPDGRETTEQKTVRPIAQPVVESSAAARKTTVVSALDNAEMPNGSPGAQTLSGGPATDAPRDAAAPSAFTSPERLQQGLTSLDSRQAPDGGSVGSSGSIAYPSPQGAPDIRGGLPGPALSLSDTASQVARPPDQKSPPGFSSVGPSDAIAVPRLDASHGDGQLRTQGLGGMTPRAETKTIGAGSEASARSGVPLMGSTQAPHQAWPPAFANSDQDPEISRQMIKQDGSVFGEQPARTKPSTADLRPVQPHLSALAAGGPQTPVMHRAGLNAATVLTDLSAPVSADPSTSVDSTDGPMPRATEWQFSAGSSPLPSSAAPARPLERPMLVHVVHASPQPGQGSVDIMLSPEELGRMRVSLAHVDGSLVVTLSAERQETQELLRRHGEDLAQEYRNLGYTSVDLQFETAEHASEQFEQENASVDASGDPPLPQDASTIRANLSLGTLDIRI